MAGEELGDWASKGIDYAWNHGTEYALDVNSHAISGTPTPDEARVERLGGQCRGPPARQMNLRAPTHSPGRSRGRSTKGPPSWSRPRRDARTWNDIKADPDQSAYDSAARARRDGRHTCPTRSLENTYKTTFQDLLREAASGYGVVARGGRPSSRLTLAGAARRAAECLLRRTTRTGTLTEDELPGARQRRQAATASAGQVNCADDQRHRGQPSSMAQPANDDDQDAVASPSTSPSGKSPHEWVNNSVWPVSDPKRSARTHLRRHRQLRGAGPGCLRADRLREGLSRRARLHGQGGHPGQSYTRRILVPLKDRVVVVGARATATTTSRCRPRSCSTRR